MAGIGLTTFRKGGVVRGIDRCVIDEPNIDHGELGAFRVIGIASGLALRCHRDRLHARSGLTLR